MIWESVRSTLHLLCRIPSELPKNVRFIISTLPDDSYGILKSARHLGLSGKSFIEVNALDEKIAWKVLDEWLGRRGRTVSLHIFTCDSERETVIFGCVLFPPGMFLIVCFSVSIIEKYWSPKATAAWLFLS